MNIEELIRTRKSVRTFDGRKLEESDVKKLRDYVETINNPYDIPVRFVLLDAKEHGLSNHFMEGEPMYIVGLVKDQPHCVEAFGFSFEKMVLYAWSLGIGTTVMGNFDRKSFGKAAGVSDDEIMMLASPLGYQADRQSEVDKKLRNRLKADERHPFEKLFFEESFSKPLTEHTDIDVMEAVRWAPSGGNLQPWRIVKDGNRYHFYLHRRKPFRNLIGWDGQKIDIGIAICHFMSVKKGHLVIEDPEIECDELTEYVATVETSL